MLLKEHVWRLCRGGVRVCEGMTLLFLSCGSHPRHPILPCLILPSLPIPTGVTSTPLSRVGSTLWKRIMQATRLHVHMGVRLQPTTREVPLYEWDARTERMQKENYMAHLRSILQLPDAYGEDGVHNQGVLWRTC